MGISELTALELGKEIKEKRISVREAVQASLERIHKYEDTVHAYVTLTEEAALAQADEIQKQIDDGTLTGPRAMSPSFSGKRQGISCRKHSRLFLWRRF